MPEPIGALQALRASTADLLQGLENSGWSDADVAAPSLCPGWSRGHVLTHLARNADGIAGTVSGALRGELVRQYPGGQPQRNGDIESGAARPFAALVEDVRESAARLDRVFGAVHDADAWATVGDRDLSAAHWVAGRLKEVEVHRVDLDAGYGPQQWPPLLVADLLPATIEQAEGAWRITVTEPSVVPEFAGRAWTVGDGPAQDVRGADWAVLAWLLGRAGRP